MNTAGTDTAFAGSIPKLYERHLVPLIFEPYASDLAARVASRSPSRVLEIAAGTGVVTRALASILPPGAVIVATDLNQAMLDQAKAIGTSRPVEWRQADAMRLPFPDASFDVVFCRYLLVHLPDPAAGMREMMRVVRPGGRWTIRGDRPAARILPSLAPVHASAGARLGYGPR